MAVQLLNKLDPARFDVRMGLLRAAGPYLDQVDPTRLIVAPDGEKYFNYDGPNEAQYSPRALMRSILRAPRAFRTMVEQGRPDVVLSFLKGTNLLVWLALQGLGARRPKWVAREGNNVLAVLQDEAPNPLVRNISLALTRRAYQAADAVLANSTDMAAGLVGALQLQPAKVRMINNPIDLEQISTLARERPDSLSGRPYILSVGRLEFQKGHDLLIRAFAKSGAWRTHMLLILGVGSKLLELQNLARSFGMAEHVRFEGFVANPYAFMAHADLFVLPSRWEGFPTVAAEALACEVPVLSSNCRFGVSDIIIPGKSGELFPVGDLDALAHRLERVLPDANFRRRLAGAGKAHAWNFHSSRIIGRYAQLLEGLRWDQVSGAGMGNA